MKTKYWIAFGIFILVIAAVSVYIYLRFENKKTIERPKEQKIENEIVPIQITNKEAFLKHAYSKRGQDKLKNIFEKLSEENEDAEIAFYSDSKATYFHDEDRVYWITPNTDKVVKIACDKDDFKLLRNDEEADIGICENKVFVQGENNYRFDAPTLKVLAYRYIGDSRNTFYKKYVYDEKTGINNLTLEKVEGNPTEFSSASNFLLSNNYVIANNKLYFKNKKIISVDLNTFKPVVSHFYYSDKSGYYFASEENGIEYIMRPARVIELPFKGSGGIPYVQIGEDVYFGATKLKDSITERVKPFDAENRLEGKGKLVSCKNDCPYVWDGVYVYYDGKKISGVDAKTFRLIGYGILGGVMGSVESQPEYAKDKRNVYYKGKIISSADPNTFSFIRSGEYYFIYGKDSDNVYYENIRIANANPDTFIPLGSQSYEGCSKGDYAKDDDRVYYKSHVLYGADVNSFEVLVASNGDFGKDSKNYFRGLNKVKEEDWIDCENI